MHKNNKFHVFREIYSFEIINWKEYLVSLSTSKVNSKSVLDVVGELQLFRYAFSSAGRKPTIISSQNGVENKLKRNETDVNMDIEK